jgi:hypothetical protein
MLRTVFEKIPMDGFRTQKVESLALAVTNTGHQRMFVGTSEGQLLAYDCHANASCKILARCYVLVPVSNEFQLTGLTPIDAFFSYIIYWNTDSTRSFSCSILNTMRPVPKEKKAISLLGIAEVRGTNSANSSAPSASYSHRLLTFVSFARLHHPGSFGAS